MNNQFITYQMTEPRHGRYGFTLLEVTVAAGMLGVLLVTALQMFRMVATQQRAAERQAVALETVQALAEVVGNMRWDELSTQAVAELALPEFAAQRLPHAKLAIAVADEDKPVVAKRITIELTWNGIHDRPARPIRLTCWAYPDEP